MNIDIKFGWKPDVPDFRDIKYSAPPNLDSTGSFVDLRKWFPPAYYQGKLSSCTANAIAAAIQYERIVEPDQDMTETPSRLFIYYNERKMEGSINQDDGAYIRDGIKSVASDGYCEESYWTYDESKVFAQPPQDVYNRATKHKAVKYFRLDNTNLQMLKLCLTDEYPFVFGMSLYESFDSLRTRSTGMVDFPSISEKLIGGHAMICVGFDDLRKCFIVRNSWSERWGDKGHCYIPYHYMTHPDLSADFWTIRICD